jgi:IS30 family transposase
MQAHTARACSSRTQIPCDARSQTRREDRRRDHFGHAIFARIEPALRKSITFDNDTAFAQHALLRTMRAMTTWFCDAYASWQKGGIENANGRLRRWLPRQIDIDKVSDEEIQDIVVTANLTPRKCLGFKTPFQAIVFPRRCRLGAPPYLDHARFRTGRMWPRHPRMSARSVPEWRRNTKINSCSDR